MTTAHLYDPPYALWTIWHQLSLLNRGIVLILGVVFVYCVFSTVRTMLRLYTVWNRPAQEQQTVRDAIAVLATRYSRLRQVIGATFYLFGLVLFVGLESITNVLGDGKEPIGIYVIDNFLLLCAFAANVFLIFLVLHSIQWAGSAVLDSFSRHVSSQSSQS
jgi:Na+-transporting methylmalonyl-CoA/oxaloacetate decarboxylase gamma subunit